MIEPKIFYQKLDVILNKIKEKTGANFLIAMVVDLEKTFKEELNFANGRLYEYEEDQNFVLIYPSIGSAAAPMVARIPAASEIAGFVLRHGAHIYDHPHTHNGFSITSPKDHIVPVAFSVGSSEKQWIFVYDLMSGWKREEIDFCFNAVRAMLNLRLFADAMRKDLQQAVDIQQSLLPDNPPTISGYQIALRSEASGIVVGDLYDFYQFNGELFGVCIGDAMGHGLPAALLVRDVVTGLRMGLEKEMKMVYTIKKLNRVLHRSTYSTRFASLFYGEIERDGHLIYVNAGHPPPLLVNDHHVQKLRATGIILGGFPEIDLHRSYSLVKPGSALVMYSDGIIERINHEGKNFGIDRLKKLLRQNHDKNAEEILNMIFDAVYEYGNRKKWRDDATVIIVKRMNE